MEIFHKGSDPFPPDFRSYGTGGTYLILVTKKGDTFDFGHKKGGRTKVHKTSKIIKYSYIGYRCLTPLSFHLKIQNFET